MVRLALYFNELSAPPTAWDGGDAPAWGEWARGVFASLRTANKHNGDTEIVMLRGMWHGLCGGRPLSVWLSSWLSRLEYQWLLAKLRMIEQAPQFEVDICIDDRRTIGLAMACHAGSWAFSFPVTNSSWLNYVITASQHQLNGDDVVESNVEVRNLSQEGHATYWGAQLAEYGRTVAATNVIAEHDGYLVVMYPHDHSPPHFHLVDSMHERRTIAKFRFDMFERLEGPPQWDAHFRQWVETHRDELQRSWARCVRGGHPFQI